MTPTPLGVTALETLTFADTDDFVRVLPRLVQELMDVPAPEPAPT